VFHDPERQPTPREVRIFGLLFLPFAAALGELAVRRPHGLVGTAVLFVFAWVTCLTFQRGYRSRALSGLVLPAGLGLLGGALVGLGPSPWVVRGAIWSAGVATAIVVWSAPARGARLWRGWMRAAEPMGWTFSHLVLAVVYYGVLTPIGLKMRLFGRDPMQRRFDRQATSYWVERKAAREPGRAFRQF
jgi:hypothetical protein